MELELTTMGPVARPVAVLGGLRTPFARAGTAYTDVGALDLLTAALDGLVDRFGLHGQLIGEVAAGAVLKHSRDYNLTREAVLGSRLDPRTPAYDVQQACDTGLQAAVLVANKIALGQIEVGVAGGADSASDVPLAFSPRLRSAVLAAHRARSRAQRLTALARIRARDLAPDAPTGVEPRSGLSMHQHAAATALEWRVGREEQDELAVTSHRRLAAAYRRGSLADLVLPYRGLERDNNLRPDTDVGILAGLPPVAGTDPAAGITAGNSTPLSDGASVVLLASQEWAAAHGHQVLARLTGCQSAAVDFAGGAEGLLMAPVYAVSALLERQRRTLQDFDLYEVNEAYASQVLATLRAWEDPAYCRERLGRSAAMGSVPRDRLNVNGGALALGHPFAATGGRILAQLATELAARGAGRGLATVCAAGGLGIAVTLER